MPAVAMLVLAHAADEIIVTFDETSMTQTITLTADTLAMLAPIDADGDGELTQADLDARREALRVGVWEQAKLTPCTRTHETATLEPGFVALRARFVCQPGELTQDFRWLQILPPTYRVIFGNQVARGDASTLHLTREAARAPTGEVGWATVAWGLAGGAAATVVGFWFLRRRRR